MHINSGNCIVVFFHFVHNAPETEGICRGEQLINELSKIFYPAVEINQERMAINVSSTSPLLSIHTVLVFNFVQYVIVLIHHVADLAKVTFN